MKNTEHEICIQIAIPITEVVQQINAFLSIPFQPSFETHFRLSNMDCAFARMATSSQAMDLVSVSTDSFSLRISTQLNIFC